MYDHLEEIKNLKEELRKARWTIIDLMPGKLERFWKATIQVHES
jgi:hypothetical protein